MLSVAVVTLSGAPAVAQPSPPPTTSTTAPVSEPFASLATLPDPRMSQRLLFLPLVDAFDRCVGLTSACPASSSSLLLVPAQGKRVVWQVEGTQLPEVDLDMPVVRAVGAGPSAPERGRYLLPAVDGETGGLIFVPRRYELGGLVPVGGSSAAARSEDNLVPSIAGPLLSTDTPARDPIGALFDQPVTVAPEQLSDATAVLVARRAPPSRVAMGVRADPAWGLTQPYVPLLDANGVALLGRHAGQVGLAVSAPAGLGVSSQPSSGIPSNEDRDGSGNAKADADGDGSGSAAPVTALAAVALAVAAGAGATIVATRSRRRRR